MHQCGHGISNERPNVRAFNPPRDLATYPGSPLIARALLRPQDRLTACEVEPKARKRLIETVRLIRLAAPDLKLTVDPLERQGFEYQTGLSFTLFARSARRELGRGGRYRIGGEPGNEQRGEPASQRPPVVRQPP